ncbi:MAG: aldo/keto reductase, partial [Candidatus Bathyarchaeia archaeon]
MEYREFGRTGFKASIVGMGTYYDPLWIILATTLKIRMHATKSIDAIKIGLAGGINLIDTAEIYRTEPIVREAIKGWKREELFIASKVWWNHLRYDSVLRACERSLRHLGSDYLDLYQIHFPNSRIPIKETMSAMEKLVDDGKIRHIGISNFSLRRMKDAQEALSKHELASTQMNYNLTHRDVERDILPHCERERIAILAYYPLAHGKLSGKKLYSNDSYQKVSEKHGNKTPSQVAINWLGTRSDVVFPIPRASNPIHVKENLNAVGWKLDESDMQLF